MTQAPGIGEFDPPRLGEAVRARARSLGFDLVGFAPAAPFVPERELYLERLAAGLLNGMGWINPERARLSCDPQGLLEGACTIIALGTSYAPAKGPETAAEPGGRAPRPPGGQVGRVARYAWGRDYHEVIPPKLKELAAFLSLYGGPGTRCRTFVDTGPLLERAAAQRGGVGFYGKNTCVLTGPHGSYVFLSAILTTVEILPDPMVTKDCGSCRACIDACPTDALVSPGVLDATRCISYLTIEHRGSISRELRPLMGNWVFGCDVCQEVCPWNRARPGAVHPEFAPSEGAGATLDLDELLRLDDTQFRAKFRGTALLRAKRVGLARNAAVVLGNLGDPGSEGVLLRALSDPEPVVREHAAWALGRLPAVTQLAQTAMASALEAETDGGVKAELIATLAAAS